MEGLDLYAGVVNGINTALDDNNDAVSFHGGIGGFQTRPFILHPAHLEVPPGPILGAASVHGILAGWRADGKLEGLELR